MLPHRLRFLLSPLSIAARLPLSGHTSVKDLGVCVCVEGDKPTALTPAPGDAPVVSTDPHSKAWLTLAGFSSHPKAWPLPLWENTGD